MATIDVFKGDAFSAINMTRAIDKMGHAPRMLFDMPGLFEDVPVTTTDVFIESRADGPALIQTSPRGAPPESMGGDQREARSFRTRRIIKKSTIHSHEIQNVRAFGTESELQNVMTEVARRQQRLTRDVYTTLEYHCLGAVQGLVKDKDASTIYNWATEFGQAIPAEVAFDFAGADVGEILIACNNMARGMLRALGDGQVNNDIRITALAGDQFFDQLTTSEEVRETFKGWQAAQDLRKGSAFGAFSYGNIDWINYRGTDDNTTVGIPTDKAKFFPVNAGIFQRAWAPAEPFDFVNTPGKELYSWVVFDKDRNSWVDVEVASYPLMVCTMPGALGQGRAGG
nr:major capsid protein [uncultured Dongia sp.]